MPDPFTIRVFVPTGDPEGIRVIDRMNWTGTGVVFPREEWSVARQRTEFERPGVYILVGYSNDEDDLPTIYVGQGDVRKNRIDLHSQQKDFWNWAIAFVSNSGVSGLNRAHITWLEYALVNRAAIAGQCILDNGNTPQEPPLTEFEKADVQGFLKEIIQILPLVSLQVFELPKAVAQPKATTPTYIAPVDGSNLPLDTIVVPAKKDGFENVFLKERAWYAIRISGGMRQKLKYIAAYQTQPTSAITHYAPIDRIEEYGAGGKYKVIFSEIAKPIGPIPFADAPSGSMQGPRFTSLSLLLSAKKLVEAFPK